MEPVTIEGRVRFVLYRKVAPRRQMIVALVIAPEGEPDEYNVILAEDVPADSWHADDRIAATGQLRLSGSGHAELIDARISPLHVEPRGT